jgi:S-adenosylmethionine:tRNA ribosyltransferase-isomerase
MVYSTEDFNYYLPVELIAQQPVKPRDHSRLLILHQETGAIEHQNFFDLPKYLLPGDLLVLNNSRVFPARLMGFKLATGGKIEIFLHQRIDDYIWECLIGGHVKPGLVINFTSDQPSPASVRSVKLSAEVLQDNGDGTWLVKFNLGGSKFFKEIDRIGRVPLPHYIKRTKQLAHDKNTYQTVFADKRRSGSVAAPTAGLHFTTSLLKKIKDSGVNIEYVTLHVGLGTFTAVKTAKLTEHQMHSELAIISPSTIQAIIRTKRAGGRVIAVGTTSCRTLESVDWSRYLAESTQNSAAASNQSIVNQELSFWTDIFIYPGYQFKVVDALITNFHLPKSTLIMLVSALAGKDRIDQAYQEAISRRYRFFSYGDAMFIC